MVSVEVRGSEATVRVQGRASVSSAATVRACLIEALESANSVAVDLAEITDADASLVQLLLSARVTADEAGVDLRVSRRGYGFERALVDSGFDPLLRADWVAGGETVQFYFFEEEEA